MKKILQQLLGIPLILLATNPAIAQFAEIKQIPVGTETLEPLAIYLPPGQGITLNYGKVEQTVETLWLDNKRFVGVDSDGCLSGLNGSCPKNEATMLHLRLIEALPVNAIENSNNSLLTVVTVDRKGARRFYIYKIQPEYGYFSGNNIKLIEYIMPSNTTSYDAKKIIANIKIAIDRGLIRDLKLIERTNKFVQLLQDGMDVEQAGREAQLSPRFIEGISAR